MLANRKIVPVGDELFINRKGNTWAFYALTHRWYRTLRRAARETGIQHLSEVPAGKLRAAFATLVGKLGIPDRLVKPIWAMLPEICWGATIDGST